MDGSSSPASAPRATSYDVAQRAGVSQSAVSRCFRNGAAVSSAMRAKVLDAASALQYAPNQMARSLITRRSRIVAVLVGEATANFYPTLLLQLGREIQAAGSRMLTCILPPDNDTTALVADILGFHVDAVVCAIAVPDSLVDRCAAHRIPVVVYNRSSPHPWASAVGCDDAAALDRLAAHLRATGTTRLHILAGPADSQVAQSRLAAAIAAAAAHGLAVTATIRAAFSYEGGCHAAPALLAAGPDTILCGNDAMALGVLDTLRHEHGVAIPGTIAVTGYDDIPDSARPPYQLTTLAQPAAALSRAAVFILRERLDGDAIPGEQRLMPARLVVRASTRPPCAS